MNRVFSGLSEQPRRRWRRDPALNVRIAVANAADRLAALDEDGDRFRMSSQTDVGAFDVNEYRASLVRTICSGPDMLAAVRKVERQGRGCSWLVFALGLVVGAVAVWIAR